MSVWKVGKNERFHNKKVYCQYTDDGRSTALTLVCGSSVMPRKNEKWVPDTKRGWGMKRENPIIRHYAETCVIMNCHNCPDRYALLFISWTEKPLPEDDLAYSQYLQDEKHDGFLGIAESGSAITTAMKKYMKTH
ncbi:MAG: hypothetical protein PHX61_02400 [Alphaproteobacteria bacterium]|nr:hypothetical protein [Alphaproteobacteria bacterium]